MPIKECNQRCGGCALTDGAAANLEPKNRLTAELAVLGPSPFYCHEHINYAEIADGFKITRKYLRDAKIMLCSGWLESVKELAATGYYDENPIITKGVAACAQVNLEIFLAADNDDDKNSARENLTRLIGMLAEKRKRFLKAAPEVKLCDIPE